MNTSSDANIEHTNPKRKRAALVRPPHFRFLTSRFSTPSSLPGWWKRWRASRETQRTIDPIQLVWMVKEIVFRSRGGGQSYSPSRQAGWGLSGLFRRISLARHLLHHPHEADGVEKAQRRNFRFRWASGVLASPSGSRSDRTQKRLRKRRPTGRYRYVRLRWHTLFAIVDFVGEIVHAFLLKFSAGRIPNDPFAAPGSVLLVQLDHLGDAVLTAAMLPALRRHWPLARIEVLAASWNREIFDACDEVDEVHVSRVNRFAPGWRPFWPFAQIWWGLRLRRKRFDLGLDVRGEMPLAAILWVAGVRRRVGWDCGGGGFLLTDSAKFVAGRPEMESRLALMRLIGIDAPESLLAKAPWFVPPAVARASVRNKLERSEACAGRLFVFHIGAGTAAKRWPASHWQELLGRVIVECGASVILLGGRSERPIADEVLGGHAWPGVENWTGRITVPEMAALIQRADLFVGADSGPAHLASAVGTPAVVLFSGTNRPRQWRPWGRRVAVAKHPVVCSPCHLTKCPLAGHPCMTGLRPEAVMRRVRVVLEEGGSASVEARIERSVFVVQEVAA
jgi:ADP-heptose:LPS heptosyltransferase